MGDIREALVKAITEADANFGYRFNMTKLVDGVATHTLFMDGFDPVDFEDRDDGYRLIVERRNCARTDAILAALHPPADDVAIERVAIAEARRVCVDYRLNPHVYERHGGKHPIQPYIEDAIKRAIKAYQETARDPA